MTTATQCPAWCDPTPSREERIAAVGLAMPDGPVSFGSLACPCCNAAMYSPSKIVSDRYGIDHGLSRCGNCGVRYLSVRPPADWYANFYASGTYRKLVSAYHGRDVMATIQREQEEYAFRLIQRIPWGQRIGHRILDVGGSTGKVGEYVALARQGMADVLDPSPEYRDSSSTNFIQGTLETFETGHRYDLVLLCQTIDHLLEPRACLEKIRGLLASDGLFFVDILDTEQEVAEKGWQQTLKIDHPFYFTDKSARLLLAATGFEIVDSWESAKNHLAYLCKGRA